MVSIRRFIPVYLLAGGLAHAHEAETAVQQGWLTGFFLGILGLGWLFRKRLPPSMSRRLAAFLLALAMLVLSLLSPLAVLAHHSFAAHMVQHMLLMLGAAALLAYSAPAWLLLWVLPLASRQRIGPAWRWLNKRLQGLSDPLIAWLMFAAVVWLWHLPRLYSWALAHPTFHALEHFTMLLSAVLFWWVIVQPLGRKFLSPGAGVLYLMTTLIHSGLLGALLTLAPVPFYTSEGLPGLSTLEDQQLAGLIMWVPMGLVLGAWVVALLGQWLRHMEEKLPG